MIEKTKYSNRGHISMDSIPIEDTELALEEFAGSSNGLAKSLRGMWQNGIKTYSSYAEVEDPCDIAYIKIEKGKNLFCFFYHISSLKTYFWPQKRLDSFSSL